MIPTEITTIEWLALLTGIIYIWRASSNKWDAWLYGMVSCSSWAYASYFFYQLFADAVLQVFYVGMAAWGLWNWNALSNVQKEISRMNIQEHVVSVVAGFFLGGLYAYYLFFYTEASFPILDALTTMFAVLTTILLVQRKLENWIYWFFINLAYLYIYFQKEAWIFFALSFVYLLMSVRGWIQWKKEFVLIIKNQSK